MAKESKINVKNVVLPHSQAKLDLYKNYLLHYLRVTGLYPHFSKINLFDVYCGAGLYDDGNIGSPLITNECVKQINEEILFQHKKELKSISIHINDYDSSKVGNVQKMLENKKLPNCAYQFYNKDADEMLEIASKIVNTQERNERNLVFIDPYGYSQIHSDKIFNLVKNERTEVILFLPIMQMYRFSEIAIKDPNRPCYEDLRRFIFSFFPPSHNIHTGKIANVFEYINEVKNAFSYNGKFYTCSHYIQRDKGNYYSLFFITSNIYGLDKMVEAKWKLDGIKGKGYEQKKDDGQGSLFEEEFEVDDKNMHIGNLKRIILNEVKRKGQIDNNELYELTLKHEFKVSHAKDMMLELIEEKKISPFDTNSRHVNVVKWGNVNYDHFRRRDIKVDFRKN